MSEGNGDNEHIVVRLDHVVPVVNIVTIYGQKECRTARGEIFESWARLEHDLDEIDHRGEAFLIMGDLNRAVGSDKLGVFGNRDRVSYGGQLVRDMVERRNCVILNNINS